jgi:acyl-CoA dehydrogenase
MHEQVSEEIRIVGDSLLGFINAEVVPLERENARLLSSERTIYDERGFLVPEILELRKRVRLKSAEAGFYTMLGAESLGGGGLSATAAVYLHELLARKVGPGRILIHYVVIPSMFTNGLSPVLEYLNPSIRGDYLPFLQRGEKTTCFALSEPDAGSDVYGIKTTAVRDGDSWLLTGSKQWISNSPYADYAMVFAVTDREKVAKRKGGITAFFVDTRSAGFQVMAVTPVMGHLGGDQGIIALDGVRVADDHRLGETDQGLNVAMHGINAGRLGVAGSCVGYAQWGLRLATEYAKTRRTFGKPIAEHQAIQFHLAEAAMDLFAAKSVVMNCAARLDGGHDARAEIAIAKAYATEMLHRTIDHCMQFHGAMGMTNEVGLEMLYRDARAMRVYDGTAEIQRRTIALELLNDALRF